MNRKPAKERPELKSTVTVAELPEACASEPAAVAFIERQRWGAVPCCPRCGSVAVYQMTDRKTGERNRRYLWRCRDCKQQYSCRTGTIFEESLIPMHKWCRAFWEAGACKNGVSALELMRKLQVTYKTALFMAHRIRHAMAPDPKPDLKLSGTVEIDETYVGGKPRKRKYTGQKGPNNVGRSTLTKTPVMAVVERGGNVRTRVVANVTAENVRKVLEDHVERGSIIMTDDFGAYRRVVREHGPHKKVRHSMGEYVKRSDPSVHTNTIEGFFSRVKRLLNGTWHAVSKKHLPRYLAHTAFLYNARELNDGERTTFLIQRSQGKRLTYRDQVDGAA